MSSVGKSASVYVAVVAPVPKKKVSTPITVEEDLPRITPFFFFCGFLIPSKATRIAAKNKQKKWVHRGKTYSQTHRFTESRPLAVMSHRR